MEFNAPALAKHTGTLASPKGSNNESKSCFLPQLVSVYVLSIGTDRASSPMGSSIASSNRFSVLICVSVVGPSVAWDHFCHDAAGGTG